MPAAIESINLGFLLDGQWRNEGERIEIFSPGTRQRVGVTHRATSADAEAAIRAATRAFEVTRRMGGYERQRILRTISSGIEKHSEELARMVALEAGKPIKTARTEVDRAVFTFSVAAEEAVRVGGEYLPLDWQASTAERWGIVRRFPLGPIAAITPFNFPSILVSDNRLKLLSFTGSTAVGWALKQKAGKKRVVLELGGNAGVVICADANLEYAADRCVIGGFGYAGQSCISVQRILVEESAYEKFVSALASRVQKLKVGNVLDDGTDVGPLINEEAARRVIAWIEEAVRDGAKIVCGGHRNGAMVTPTVLTHTKPEMRVNCMEIFGPVVTVEKFSDYEDSLNTLNRSEFGLQAGVFTRDFKRITRAFETLEVGGLMIGEVPTFRIDHMPYGGTKDSGLGREGLRYAIEEMTEPRLLAVNPAGL